ncbi:hypothetical protein EJ06DRAFT_499034 [Trichodelitschia bisporula]|uniref:Protein PNS1 n=1 Tax=Trichodelitschia bisporula TaxID=703511 RepID=A0A6G1HMR7_9PEZI|nr:hypothetical protein EJ06DRAFT_499034 [Trichodelitschia bisporula]
MFSEYASRFLAQSQTASQPDATHSSRHPDRTRASSRAALRSSRLGGNTMASPYQPSGSQLSRFPFASRIAAQQAPLFLSATEDFREEDDGEEHEREVTDYYALQKSRRYFGASNLTESSEIDDPDHSSHVDDRKPEEERPHGTSRGIRSSWRGDKSTKRGRPRGVESVAEHPDRDRSTIAESQVSASSRGRGRLVDVELSESERSSIDAVERDEIEGDEMESDDDPPAFQTFRNSPAIGIAREHTWIPQETDEETSHLNPRPPSPDRESVPPGVAEEPFGPPRHDEFWSSFFWICLASLLGSALLVYLHTDAPPSGRNPLGDTIYSTLRSSFHLLAVDTLVAVIVAALWLALLRTYLRPLTYLILVAVPVIFFSFSLFALVSSYKGFWHGASFQDKAMRILSFVPLAGAIMWTYLSIKARHSIERAVEVLEFSCKIVAASPALVLAGFGALFVTIVWFWVWLGLFARVFLEGHWSVPRGKTRLFVIDVSTWWLGAFYALMLLWTLSIISGVHRATSAATTSQWYFHRLASPAPSSRAVVLASLGHATGSLFGTICLSTLLALAVRLPLLLLPRRMVALISFCFFPIVPAPVAALTNPLTLTYAAIHSMPLAPAARGLATLKFVDATAATTTLSPRNVKGIHGGRGQDPLLAYRTAKMLLHATRWVVALTLGIGAWVAGARAVRVVDGHGGSGYAYVVGLGAAAIGWGVLGAMEGVVLGVLDAVVVCWGSEVISERGGRYCREAGELFGGRMSDSMDV